jgi:hypothetical protein
MFHLLMSYDNTLLVMTFLKMSVLMTLYTLLNDFYLQMTLLITLKKQVCYVAFTNVIRQYFTCNDFSYNVNTYDT